MKTLTTSESNLTHQDELALRNQIAMAEDAANLDQITDLMKEAVEVTKKNLAICRK